MDELQKIDILLGRAIGDMERAVDSAQDAYDALAQHRVEMLIQSKAAKGVK